MMNRDQLLETIEKHGVPLFQRDDKEGGTIVTIPRGARVIGLFPSSQGNSACAMWINPNIQNILAGTAEDWEGEGAGSIGGERLWVSPERNFFYKDSKTFDTWMCQLPMDPGEYEELASDDESVLYQNVLDLNDGLRGVTYRNVTMRRRIQAIEAPCPESACTGLAYAGVQITDEVIFPEADEDPRACPWSLTQITPSRNGASGTVIVPTGRRAEPVGYFGEIPADRLRVADDHVAFRIDARDIYKLGLRAEDLPSEGPARIAYMKNVFSASIGGEHPSNTGEWLLVIKESEDVARTNADAVDPALADPDGPRGVIQSYNGGPKEPGDTGYPVFGEIEMQFRPLRQDAKGAWSSKATHRLLAFQGSREAIVAAAETLLGVRDIQPYES